jgi:hypothetical protein
LNCIHENCSPELAKNKKLPTNTFLVTYKVDGATRYDVAQSYKLVDIFDSYWDKYRSDLLSIAFTSGTVNPKFYTATPDKTEKKEKKNG